MSGFDLTLTSLAILLVLLAGVFACIDSAISRMSRVRAEKLLREGRNGSPRLTQITSDPRRYLNVVLLLRVAAELGATCIVTVLIVRDIGDGNWAIVIAAAVMTLVSYVLVGVAPRTIGVQHSDSIALRSAGAVVTLTRILGPLPKLLILIGNALTPGRGFPSGPFATEAELRDLVDLAEQRKVIEEGERAMIHSVFELGDTLVREVMVPRTEVVHIERGKTIKQALTLALRSGFSRIPVTGENEDDIVGVLYLKDIVRKVIDGKGDVKVDEVMRAPLFVPDSKPVDELLREMQRDQVHMAIVIDEYGGTAGLVTIEDILEEIVGEITDEYDTREVPPIERVDANTARVTSRLPVDELNELFDVDLPTDDVDTVGGLLASVLGKVPIDGASVKVQGLTLTAESPKGRRNKIGTVLVHRDGKAAKDRERRA